MPPHRVANHGSRIWTGGAGLLLRSFAELRNVDPGFVASGNTSFTTSLPESSYGRLEQQRAFTASMLDRLRRLPGVNTAAATFGLPLSDVRYSLSFTVEGKPEAPPGDEPSAQVRTASSDFFRAMGIRLLRGRGFEPTDTRDAPAVALVSAALARRYFPNEDPIGKLLHTGWKQDGHDFGGRVVGVIADVRQFGLGSDPVPVIYMNIDQWPISEITFVMNARLGPEALAPAIRKVVHELDPNLPIFDYGAMTTLVDASLAQPRLYLSLLGAFAGVALLLAAVGLYGVIAYTVQQRTRAIGVRIALGASGRRVLVMVIREGLTMSAIGVAIGVADALVLTRLLRSLLFGVTPADPLTFLGVVVALTLVAVLASVIPAYRASSIDPQLALRAD